MINDKCKSQNWPCGKSNPNQSKKNYMNNQEKAIMRPLDFFVSFLYQDKNEMRKKMKLQVVSSPSRSFTGAWPQPEYKA